VAHSGVGDFEAARTSEINKPEVPSGESAFFLRSHFSFIPLINGPFDEDQFVVVLQFAA